MIVIVASPVGAAAVSVHGAADGKGGCLLLPPAVPGPCEMRAMTTPTTDQPLARDDEERCYGRAAPAYACIGCCKVVSV